MSPEWRASAERAMREQTETLEYLNRQVMWSRYPTVHSSAHQKVW